MKNIWLIGASEGIGRALAIELGNDLNNQLIISARNEQSLEDVASNFKNRALIATLDVSDNESIMDAWNKINAADLDINTLIYCVGYYKPMSAREIQLNEVETMLDVNLIGAFRILNLIVPYFIKRNMGDIILIGSIAAYRGLPNSFGYGSSKAGLLHLAENLQCDLLNYKIKVQVINPGFVKTRLTELNKFYMPSIMTPEDAALAIIKKMRSNHFESRFPFLFSGLLKFISRLPYWLYFKITRLL